MKRLTIIAGKGHLPLDVAKTATANGYDVLVLPIEGQADADFTSYQANLIRWGHWKNSVDYHAEWDQPFSDGWQG